MCHSFSELEDQTCLTLLKNTILPKYLAKLSPMKVDTSMSLLLSVAAVILATEVADLPKISDLKKLFDLTIFDNYLTIQPTHAQHNK